MKTIEQLQQLSGNPHYKMTEEEKRMLNEEPDPTVAQFAKVSSVSEDSKKKVSQSEGNATVKEIGKLNKQHGDPRSE